MNIQTKLLTASRLFDFLAGCREYKSGRDPSISCFRAGRAMAHYIESQAGGIDAEAKEWAGDKAYVEALRDARHFIYNACHRMNRNTSLASND